MRMNYCKHYMDLDKGKREGNQEDKTDKRIESTAKGSIEGSDRSNMCLCLIHVYCGVLE
jgi:hypothetical protein